MNAEQLVKKLAAIATLNPAGYTVDANTLQPLSHGYCVAVAATQNSFGPEGLRKVVEYVQGHGNANAFGGWYDTESGLYYYDATVVCEDLGEAIEMARTNEQLAIFCLDTMKEIRIEY